MRHVTANSGNMLRKGFCPDKGCQVSASRDGELDDDDDETVRPTEKRLYGH